MREGKVLGACDYIYRDLLQESNPEIESLLAHQYQESHDKYVVSSPHVSVFVGRNEMCFSITAEC